MVQSETRAGLFCRRLARYVSGGNEGGPAFTLKFSGG